MIKTFFSEPKVALGTHGMLLFRRPLRLSISEVKTHAYVIGISGSGKSRFLAGLYLSLLRAGLPTTLIDPHGDLAQFVLAHLVADGTFRDPKALERILYLDLPGAERQGRFVPFNILHQPRLPSHTIASHLKDAMHRAYPELASGAAMFDTLLPRSVRVLIDHKLPITQLEPFLIDEEYRNSLLEDYHDKRIVDFFQQMFDELRKPDQIAYAGSVLRRAQLLTDLPILKYSFGQEGNILQFRELIDSGRSTIINLALREGEASRLLGCLLMIGFEQAAFSRSELRDDERKKVPSHHVMVDEFQNFTEQSEGSFNTMLSQTRKHGVNLILAHQTISQTSERLQGAVQNAKIKVIMQLDREDARIMAPKIGHVEPKTVRHDVNHEESESAGMAEEWETWVQAIEDLTVGEAYVSYHRHVSKAAKHLLHRKPHRVVKVKAIRMPDAKADKDELARIEEYYLKNYFRSKAEIEAELDRYRTPEEPDIDIKRTR